MKGRKGRYSKYIGAALGTAAGLGGFAYSKLNKPVKKSPGKHTSTKPNFKKPGAPTKTTTKPYRKGTVYHDDAIGKSKSFCVIKNKYPLPKKSGYKKVFQKNYDVYNNSQNLPGVGVGKLTMNAPFKLLDYSHIDRVINHVNNTNKTEQVMIERVNAKLTISNCQTAQADIQIYDLICKNDITFDSISGLDWTNPVTTINQGIQDEGGVANDYQTVGTTPFQSKFFSEFFKVKQVTKITLNPGGQHTHNISYRANMFVNKERYYWQSGGAAKTMNLRKYTYIPLVIVNGAVANDQTTKTIVSYTNPDVNMVYSVGTTYTWMSDNTVNWYKSNNLPTVFPVAAQIVATTNQQITTPTNT